MRRRCCGDALAGSRPRPGCERLAGSPGAADENLNDDQGALSPDSDVTIRRLDAQTATTESWGDDTGRRSCTTRTDGTIRRIRIGARNPSERSREREASLILLVLWVSLASLDSTRRPF